jgi:gamma-glutamyltranspeptidase/glutathione hydrolase
MVASADGLASEAGIEALARGGSAVDAALAANAVLAVTAPHLCGMGGDLFALVHAASGPPAALNASGRAGSGADPDRLRAEGGRRMPFRHDVRSVTVPGCVDGWLALHARYGRLGLDEVLAAAIHHAEAGFPTSPLLAFTAPMVADVGDVDDWAGRRLHEGQLIRRARTAAALRAVVAAGRDGFYGGAFGEGLLERGGGEFGEDDLGPTADWVDPLGLAVWGRMVWTIPPNSQGYLVLASAGIAERLGLPDPDDPAWPHLLVEASRAAGHDRPDVLHEGADGAALVDAARRRRIDPERRPPEVAMGDTTVVAAVDEDRMGVTLIQSNAADFGAHLVEPNTGTFLHNRGIGFSLEPGHPAEYGPGRRPPHTLSPILLTGPGGELAATLGTMGGDIQPQVLLQLLARLAAGALPGPALSGPRAVLTNPDGRGFDVWDAPSTVLVERHAPPAWVEGLRQRGHAVRSEDGYGGGFGHAQLIVVEDDALAGAADPRAVIGTAIGR